MRTLQAAALILTSVAATQAQAGNKLTWRADLLQARGLGCQFTDTPERPADAHVITAGNEFSVVFSKLGEIFRRDGGPRKMVSICRFVLPAEVDERWFVAGIQQTLIYGVVKTKNVSARIGAKTNFARRKVGGESDERDLKRNLAVAEIEFEKDKAIHRTLEASVQPELRFENDDDMYARFCERENRFLNFHSDIGIWITRFTPNADISIAVDGLDVRYDMKLETKDCRKHRREQ